MIATNAAIVESINDDYEYIQYNDKLRLIHSIKDDMYQMNSIIKSCNSPKQGKHWFDNKSTKEFLENSSGRILPNEKLYENRDDLSIELRGYYVHRLLVNHIAMWASPRYAWDVMELLDNLAKQQRNELQQRVVPKNHEHEYRYMIWKEDLPQDQNMIKLHLVRRNKNAWREVNKIRKNKNMCWYFKDNLPIAMTPNKDIKKIIQKMFKGDDYIINGFDIIIKKELLNELYEAINNYFDKMQL